MSVLIVTHSTDNRCVALVMEELQQRHIEAIRFDTDRYPTDIQLSTRYRQRQTSRNLTIDGRVWDLAEVQAVWYRRFAAGVQIPHDLGDLRPPSVDESRRTLYGTIASLECLQVDRLQAVRHADHKELQLNLARKHGLEVPATLMSNDPAAVRAFYDECGGRMVTKMQSSFAVYREDQEQVVFTNVVQPSDLDDLDGLRFSPMTFQEMIPKSIELRCTVVGRQVFTAGLASSTYRGAEVDWRRQGLELLRQWEAWKLPPAVEAGLLGVMSDLGLVYGAADIIVTPDGRHIFLEVNAGGEWLWLNDHPGLPIASALADLLSR